MTVLCPVAFRSKYHVRRVGPGEGTELMVQKAEGDGKSEAAT